MDLSSLLQNLQIRSGKSRRPKVLERLDIPSIAKYIKSDKCKNIFLMTGAGISTSAGIPDFRSPDTGLYANLARLRLPYPEAVFDIDYFRGNPQPFYTLASELYPGYYRPTVTHSFIRLLAEKKLLHTCFTQNIDTLERVAGVPKNHIIEAHGSFATQRCIKCKREFPDDEMKELVMKAQVPRCHTCKGLVKPDIVFFGEDLPKDFTKAVNYLNDADLLIIMGTSLTVHPFAGLRSRVPASCPRILINLDKVGDIGSRSDDVVLLMDCDEAVRKLCDEIGDGWRKELEELWKGTEGSFTPRPEPKPEVGKDKPEGKRNAHLEKEVARMAKEVGGRATPEDDEGGSRRSTNKHEGRRREKGTGRREQDTGASENRRSIDVKAEEGKDKGKQKTRESSFN
ncbi:Sir2 histone deacetylase Hst2 [Tulasnella sp. JGI-2019a]|nr:Sir2 histone deacetylase Hst2 [Tulasnella sp. JGI-2019a]KAG9014099.1 Sir2 histone deacetylase Hst2 [Tulasnella sp. JGI-2019a]